MNYDNDQVEKFNRYTLEEYNNSLQIDKIAKVTFVKKTDGSFIQMGIRHLIEDDMFRFKNWHPSLPSIGRVVAIGERDFLIKNILENKEIRKEELKKRELLNFPSNAYEFPKATILISLDFFVEISMKLMHRIKYENGKTILDDNYNLDFIPGEMMKNKMIIIGSDAIIWEKQKFFNKYTKKEEDLDISIIPMGFKADITIRSLNKLRYLNPERIKILEVEK